MIAIYQERRPLIYCRNSLVTIKDLKESDLKELKAVCENIKTGFK